MEKSIVNNSAEYWQRYALNLKDEKDALEMQLKDVTKKLDAAGPIIGILLEKIEVLLEEIDLWRAAAGIKPLSPEYKDVLESIKEANAIHRTDRRAETDLNEDHSAGRTERLGICAVMAK